MINTVFLMLGDNCNFKCRHCLQVPDAVYRQDTVVSKLSDDLLNYVKKLANEIKNDNNKLMVRFWGGEPLVYLDSIKLIIEQLKDENVDMGLITNGELITKEFANFANDNNISVTVSHDGYETEKVRGLDVFKNAEILENFKSIRNKSVNGIIHAYNQDYFKFAKFINETFPDGIRFTFEPLVVNWEMPEDIYNFDIDAYKKTMDKLVYKAVCNTVNGKDDMENIILNNYVDRIRSFITSGQVSINKPDCCQVHNVINVDMDGNIYSCHNNKDKVGTIYDSQQKLEEKYLNDHTFIFEYEDCKSCDQLYICHGGCPLSKPSIGKTKACEIRKINIQAAYDYIFAFSDDESLNKILERGRELWQ